MKKKLLAMAAGVLMTTALVGAEETAKAPSFNFHPWGIFYSSTDIASGTFNSSSASSDMSTMMFIGGLTADYNGTGISFTSDIIAPYINSATLPGALPDFYDMHTTFLDGKVRFALGKIDDGDYYVTGDISSVSVMGESGLGGGDLYKYVYSTTSDGSAEYDYMTYDPYWGYELKVKPTKSLSIAAWVPVADNNNTSLDISDSVKLIDYGLSYQFGSFGTFKGGYLGTTKQIYGYFTLTTVKNLFATIGVDENLDMDDITSSDTDNSTTFASDIKYTGKNFVLYTEDKYIYEKDSSDSFDFRVQGDLNLVENGDYRARLNVEYSGAPDTFSDNNLYVTPSILLNTPSPSMFLTHYLSAGVKVDLLQKTWSIPVGICLIGF